MTRQEEPGPASRSLGQQQRAGPAEESSRDAENCPSCGTNAHTLPRAERNQPELQPSPAGAEGTSRVSCLPHRAHTGRRSAPDAQGRIFTLGGQCRAGRGSAAPRGHAPSHKRLEGLKAVLSQLVILHVTVLDNQRDYLLQMFSWERQRKLQ